MATRSTEAIREEALEICRNQMALVVAKKADTDEDDLSQLHSDIVKGELLTRARASLLYNILIQHSQRRMRDVTIEGRYMSHITVMELDALSIYPDIYLQYCTQFSVI